MTFLRLEKRKEKGFPQQFEQGGSSTQFALGQCGVGQQQFCEHSRLDHLQASHLWPLGTPVLLLELY